MAGKTVGPAAEDQYLGRSWGHLQAQAELSRPCQHPKLTVFDLFYLIMAHISFSLSANDFVKFGGICWTITIPGTLAGSLVKTSFMASVPPVDAPIAITLSVVSLSAEYDSLG